MHCRLGRRRIAIEAAFAFVVCVGRLATLFAGPPQDDYRGRLLVAASRLADPRFAETVVLVVEHDDNGAFGLVVNRPAGTVPLSHLFKDVLVAPSDEEVTLYFGGPVELDTAFLLHSSDVVGEGTREVVDGVFLSTGVEMLHKVGQPDGPAKFILLAGYAGWGPGQLERECAEGAWYTVKAKASLIFSGHPEKIWDRLIDKLVVRF